MLFDRPKSSALFESMKAQIPGGVNSPVRAFRGLSDTPMIVERASGDTVWDVDGNSYIDLCSSWGALALGHAHPAVVEATQEQMTKGSSYGISSAVEGKMAEKLLSIADHLDSVRFVNTGTEATMSAARLARGFTGRELIIKFNGCYHGHADFFLVQAGSGVVGLTPTSSSAGVPESVVEHTLSIPYNDVEALEQVFKEYADRIAGVIIEPIAGNMGVVPPPQSYINRLRELTHRSGAVLIFDEVMTGFRVARLGAREWFDVVPDITVYGKVIGGGYPVAAFGGRQEIMDHLAPNGAVYQAGTLSGCPVAMEAGYQTLCTMESNPHFFEEMKAKVDFIATGVEEAIKETGMKACVQTAGGMFTVFFGKSAVRNIEETNDCDLEQFKRFFAHLFNHGVYISPSQYEGCFLTSAHTQDHLVKVRDLMVEFVKEESCVAV